MEFTALGRTQERLSEIGLGTWKMIRNERSEIEALRAGIRSEINFVDTAEVYGSEPMVGKAIRDEKDIFLATKVSPTHFHYDDVIRACNASLGRLGVKKIDLYQLHWPSSHVPIGETMRAMEKLVDDGKIRYIGVSNFSVEEMKGAQEALKKNELVSNQVEYSLLVRYTEKEILEYCRKEHISVIAYSPLAHGHLYDWKYQKLNEFLSKTGESYGKSATQVAVNWLISKGNVIPIPKASTRDHVLELVGATGWRLKKEDVETINHFLGSYREESLSSRLPVH